MGYLIHGIQKKSVITTEFTSVKVKTKFKKKYIFSSFFFFYQIVSVSCALTLLLVGLLYKVLFYTEAQGHI